MTASGGSNRSTWHSFARTCGWPKRLRRSATSSVRSRMSKLDRKSTRLNQSRLHLVCRLLLEKKKKKQKETETGAEKYRITTGQGRGSINHYLKGRPRDYERTSPASERQARQTQKRSLEQENR